MDKHTEIGKKGEQIAVNFLKNKGYEILSLNWRSGKKEIDIIAVCGNEIVFTEVKSRSSFRMGFPEEAVHPHKQALLKAAAESYLESNPNTRMIRFDIISILMPPGSPVEILHLEDAFY